MHEGTNIVVTNVGESTIEEGATAWIEALREVEVKAIESETAQIGKAGTNRARRKRPRRPRIRGQNPPADGR